MHKKLIQWQLVNFCEFDKYAIKSYCAVHGVSESLNLGDITKVDEKSLPKFTMICGGSPCQDFSVSGKQSGSRWKCCDCGFEYNPLIIHYSERNECPNCGSKNLEKTRSSLLVEWLRIIEANKPDWGIYENVKNIVGKKFKDTFQMFLDELHEYGYNTHYKVLNAKDFGIPQNRERVYLIIIKKELDNGLFEFPEGFDNGIRLTDVLEDDVPEKFYINNQKTQKLIYGLVKKESARKIRGGGYYEPDLPQDGFATCPVGYIENGTGMHQSNTVYDSRGISRCLSTKVDLNILVRKSNNE